MHENDAKRVFASGKMDGYMNVMCRPLLVAWKFILSGRFSLVVGVVYVYAWRHDGQVSSTLCQVDGFSLIFISIHTCRHVLF